LICDVAHHQMMSKIAKFLLKQFLPVSIQVKHIDPVSLSQRRTGFVLVHKKTEMWWNWAQNWICVSTQEDRDVMELSNKRKDRY